jgi:3-deoxy-D-manno-octulosonic-acid transferase
VSNSAAQADADYAASAADLAATGLSIAAQTAFAWIALNEALAQERIAILSFEARDRVLTITDRRVRSGVSDPLELRTARSALASAEAGIAARRQASTEAARRLEVLLGRYPGAEITATATIPELEEMATEGNPALLLSRRPDIAALAGDLPVARRGAGQEAGAGVAVYVADTLGELGLFYRLARVALIGGSLVPHGGQNPLEAARLGCPIVIGPHHFNFSEIITRLRAAHALVETPDGQGAAETLAGNIARILADPAAGQAMARAAAALAQDQADLPGRIATSLLPLIRPAR